MTFQEAFLVFFFIAVQSSGPYSIFEIALDWRARFSFSFGLSISWKFVDSSLLLLFRLKNGDSRLPHLFLFLFFLNTEIVGLAVDIITR